MIQGRQLSANLFSCWVGFKFHPVRTLQHIARLSAYLICVNSNTTAALVHYLIAYFGNPRVSTQTFNFLIPTMDSVIEVLQVS